MIVERTDIVLRLEATRLNRLLRIHPKLDQVEEHLQQRLILVVPARRREGREGLAPLQHDRRREGNPRALARPQLIRMARLQEEALQPVRDGNPRLAGEKGRQPCPARRRREDVPRRIDDVDTRRVVGPLVERDARGPRLGLARRRSQRASSQWVSRALLERGPAGVDQRPPHRGVLLREERRPRDLDHPRIPVVPIPIGEGQLDRLDRRVHVLRRIVAHRLQVIPFKQVERLEHDRPLAPETDLVDLIPPVGRAHRPLDLGPEAGQV